MFTLSYENNLKTLNIGQYNRRSVLVILVIFDVNSPDNISSPWGMTIDRISIGTVSFSKVPLIVSASVRNITVDSNSYQKISDYYKGLGCSVGNGYVSCDKIGDELYISNYTTQNIILDVPSSSLWLKNNNSYDLAINNGTQWILGEILLENFLTGFFYGNKYKNPRIGFYIAPIPVYHQVIYI
jgi:Eukaryotic aspartyl protease